MVEVTLEHLTQGTHKSRAINSWSFGKRPFYLGMLVVSCTWAANALRETKGAWCRVGLNDVPQHKQKLPLWKPSHLASSATSRRQRAAKANRLPTQVLRSCWQDPLGWLYDRTHGCAAGENDVHGGSTAKDRRRPCWIKKVSHPSTCVLSKSNCWEYVLSIIGPTQKPRLFISSLKTPEPPQISIKSKYWASVRLGAMSGGASSPGKVQPPSSKASASSDSSSPSWEQMNWWGNGLRREYPPLKSPDCHTRVATGSGRGAWQNAPLWFEVSLAKTLWRTGAWMFDARTGNKMAESTNSSAVALLRGQSTGCSVESSWGGITAKTLESKHMAHLRKQKAESNEPTSEAWKASVVYASEAPSRHIHDKASLFWEGAPTVTRPLLASSALESICSWKILTGAWDPWLVSVLLAAISYLSVIQAIFKCSKNSNLPVRRKSNLGSRMKLQQIQRIPCDQEIENGLRFFTSCVWNASIINWNIAFKNLGLKKRHVKLRWNMLFCLPVTGAWDLEPLRSDLWGKEKAWGRQNCQPLLDALKHAGGMGFLWNQVHLQQLSTLVAWQAIANSFDPMKLPQLGVQGHTRSKAVQGAEKNGAESHLGGVPREQYV